MTRPTLIAKIFEIKPKRRKKLLDEREFDALDFTRAWRSMRCWAWRHGLVIQTEKAKAKEEGVVQLCPPAANKTKAE